MAEPDNQLILENLKIIQAGIADLEVQLRNALIELKRAQQLRDAGVQTQEALDNASTTADSLRAKIELAKQQVTAAVTRIAVAQQSVDNCVIRAPFPGILAAHRENVPLFLRCLRRRRHRDRAFAQP